MKVINSTSIRLRILFLTILTIIPVICFIVYINITQLNSAKELEKEKLQTAAQIASTEHSQIIEGARQLLISLSTSPQVQSLGDTCANYLRGLLTKYKRYNNMAFANLEGDVICNAAAVDEQVINVKSRHFFKNVLSNKEFSIGEYSIGQTTGKPVLSFGYPVFDDSNQLIGVVYSTLDLEWLSSLEANLELGEESNLLVLDKNGKILASNQNNHKIGDVFPSKNLLSQLKQSGGFVEDKIDSGDYFYSFEKIAELDSGPFAVIGVPKSTVFKKPDENFQNSLAISFVIAIFTVLGGWYIGNSLITKLILAMENVEELRRDFVSLVSHQIRTPLTSIKYFSEILLSGSPGKMNNTQREFITDISTSTNRLISLVGILVEVSRIESGKVKLQLEKTSLIEMLQESISEISPSFESKNIKVRIVKGENFPDEISIDKRLIKQAISNLISNAYKYSYPKTTILIRLEKTKNSFIFSVQNNGIRLSDKDRTLIFSKFYRAIDATKMHEEGSGIGLYLTKLIIDAHKGKIWLTSLKKRTAFYFSLPI